MQCLCDFRALSENQSKRKPISKQTFPRAIYPFARSPEAGPGLLILTLSTFMKVARSGSIVSAVQMRRGEGAQGKGCKQT